MIRLKPLLPQIFFIVLGYWSYTCFGGVSLESSNLPIFKIDTRGRRIKDDPRIEASMAVIWDQTGKRNKSDDTHDHYHGKISIEIRGSYSQTFPKKQYAITTLSDTGSDVEVPLLGLPKDEDWILYAPYSDKSLMRNSLMYRIGQEFGRYTTRTRFCELIINDQYEGVYVLIERIKRGPDRVAIAKLKESDISGDDVTGGYIVKLDKTTGDLDSTGWRFRSPGKKYVQTHYPKPQNIKKEQYQYIKTYMNEIDNAFNSSTSPLSNELLKQRLDIQSFVDYFIISEFCKNIDAYCWSVFMYKDKDSNGGKLTMGPIWDFNIAFGNIDTEKADKTEGFLEGNIKLNINWWTRLLKDPLFTSKVTCRWKTLRQNTLKWTHIETIIDSFAAEVDEAQGRNFKRWNILNKKVWPNNYVGGTYAKEITYLKSWIKKRITWLDNNMPGKCEAITALRVHKSFTDVQVHSSAGFGRIMFDLKEKTTVTVHLFDIHGRLVKTILDNRAFPAGRNVCHWTSKKDNGHELGQGMYTLVLSCNSNVIKTFNVISLH